MTHSAQHLRPMAPDFRGQAPVSDRVIHTLVIEDSEFDQKRLNRVCDETGLTFQVCGLTGLEGLRAQLDDRKFDLALVDYRLAEGDGLTAVRRIRSHPAQMNAAILMLTGQGDLDLAVDAMKAGCSDFLDKAHLTPAALRRATLNALEKSQLHHELMRARGLNHKLQELMQGFASDTVAEMKPIVLDLMRQTRARMANPMKADKETTQTLAACRKLWAILDAMEDTHRNI